MERRRRGSSSWRRTGTSSSRSTCSTAAGKGICTTSKCYRQFGVQELADLEDAVSWLLKKYPQADPARVGITGWSFGGFMTGFALTHSKMFKPRDRGRRRLRLAPLRHDLHRALHGHAAGQRRGLQERPRCIEAAKNLSGHLVLVHGTMDDNVHFQNTIRLAYELQKADKQFDMMIYPKIAPRAARPECRAGTCSSSCGATCRSISGGRSRRRSRPEESGKKRAGTRRRTRREQRVHEREERISLLRGLVASSVHSVFPLFCSRLHEFVPVSVRSASPTCAHRTLEWRRSMDLGVCDHKA